MKKSLKSIADEVALFLGELLILECEPEETPFPDLESRVSIMAPGILRKLIEQAPKERLSGWKTLKNCRFTVGNDGVGTLELPDDFLLFGNLKISGSNSHIRKVYRPEDPQTERLNSRWPGINGSIGNPVVVYSVSQDGMNALKIHLCGKDAAIEEGNYYPVPAADSSGKIEIPDSLYLPLIEEIAGTLRNQ